MPRIDNIKDYAKFKSKNIRHMGALYVAFGYEFIVLCATSAISLRAHNSNINVKLITNLPISQLTVEGKDVFDDIVFVDLESKFSRNVKLRLPDYADYENNIYLDGDTFIYNSVEEIFGLLDVFDIAVRPMPYRTPHLYELTPGISTQDMQISEWNTGVILFKNNLSVNRLFERWREEYQSLGWARDQPSFLRATLTSDARIGCLGTMWNAKPTAEADLPQLRAAPSSVKILHYRDPLNVPSIARRVAAVHRGMRVVMHRHSGRYTKEWLRYDERCAFYSNMLFRFFGARPIVSMMYNMGLRVKGKKSISLRRRSPKYGGKSINIHTSP